MKRSFLFFLICLFILHPALADTPPPTPVIVATVERKPFVDEVEALGTLRAKESVDLTSTITELVTSVNFEDGQRVKEGDLLVEMAASEELAELTEEQSTLKEAKRQLDRIRPLAKKGVASESVLDQRRREYQAASARADAVKSRINRRRLLAPFDGVVGIRTISVGALVQPGTTITTVDDDSMMKLDFSVPSIYLPSLKPDVVIEATTRAFPGRVFEGRVSSVDSRIDPVTRSILVRAIIDNPDRALKPGLLMRVVLQKNPRNALLVPEEALIANGEKNAVLVVTKADDMTTVERRTVAIGQRRKGEVEILAGIQEGDKVVTHGTLRARPGMPVTIKAEQKADEPLRDMLKQNTDTPEENGE